MIKSYFKSILQSITLKIQKFSVNDKITYKWRLANFTWIKSLSRQQSYLRVYNEAIYYMIILQNPGRTVSGKTSRHEMYQHKT